MIIRIVVDRLMDSGENGRIHDRVQDGVHDHNKVINDIAGDVIGQVTAIELLEY